MSDTAEPAPEEPSLFNQPEGVDWMLAYVVALAEKDLEIGVTVAVGGQLISGTVISGRKYFDELDVSMKSATVNNQPTDEAWGDAMAGLFAGFADFYPTRELGEELAQKRGFLHLRNVTVMIGEKPSHGGVWRVQLSKVGAFTLGTIKIS